MLPVQIALANFRRPALKTMAVAATAILVCLGHTQARQPLAPTEAERCLRLQVFIRSDSALCRKAVEYAEDLVERRQGICLDVVDTLTNKEGLNRYLELVRRFRVEKPGVPAFYACDQFKIGYSSEAKSAAAIENLFAIHAYIRPTCPHCRDAKRFLMELAKRWKALRVVFHDLDHDPGAMQEMTVLARKHGISAPAYPVIDVCGRVMTGYRTDTTTGRQIEDLLLRASVSQPADESIKRELEHTENERAQLPRSGVSLTASLVSSISGAMIFANAADQYVGEIEMPNAPPDPEPSPVPKIGIPPVDEDETPSEDTYTAPVEAPEGIELPWIGYIRVRDWGLPAFTLLIGLIDGFNPCAMWVLVFLLSVLVNLQNRRKIAAIAGTFVIVSGLAYFAFMAAWLSFFTLVGIARPLQIALGILAVLIGAINVKDFYAFKKGITLSIPESVKPGIYSHVRRIVTTDYMSVAIGLSVILAVVVNVVELMCTAGFPAVYTQILTLQQLPNWKNYLYLGLYNAAYMLDDSLMVIAFVVTLSHRKMRQVEGRWLKFISGIVVLVLGMTMLFRPDWLQW